MVVLAGALHFPSQYCAPVHLKREFPKRWLTHQPASDKMALSCFVSTASVSHLSFSCACFCFWVSHFIQFCAARGCHSLTVNEVAARQHKLTLVSKYECCLLSIFHNCCATKKIDSFQIFLLFWLQFHPWFNFVLLWGSSTSERLLVFQNMNHSPFYFLQKYTRIPKPYDAAQLFRRHHHWFTTGLSPLVHHHW